MAIDRGTLVDIATFGLTTPAEYPIGEGMFYKDWIDKEALAPYQYLMEYNPDEAAKAVLDAAGFVDKDGDGWRDNPDGTPIAFKMAVPAGWDDWVNTLQTVSENLQDIGVNAEMETPEEGAWFDNIPTGNFDVYIMWTNLSSTPWFTYYSMFNPRSMNPGTLNEQAMHQMHIPAIEAALADISATADTAVQKERDHRGDETGGREPAGDHAVLQPRPGTNIRRATSPAGRMNPTRGRAEQPRRHP